MKQPAFDSDNSARSRAISTQMESDARGGESIKLKTVLRELVLFAWMGALLLIYNYVDLFRKELLLSGIIVGMLLLIRSQGIPARRASIGSKAKSAKTE